jgi:hypothetical protein
MSQNKEDQNFSKNFDQLSKISHKILINTKNNVNQLITEKSLEFIFICKTFASKAKFNLQMNSISGKFMTYFKIHLKIVLFFVLKRKFELILILL